MNDINDNHTHLTIEHNGMKMSFDVPVDINVDDWIIIFRAIMLWLTFDCETFARHLLTGDDIDD